MKTGAMDFRSGQKFEHTNFFDEAVDIYHIFPKKWCMENGKDSKKFDSIVNKTPLSARTNKIIGGAAPSKYLSLLEKGTDGDVGMSEEALDECLISHHIEPELIRSDKYEDLLTARQRDLLVLIEAAMKKEAGSDDGDDGAWGGRASIEENGWTRSRRGIFCGMKCMKFCNYY